MKSIFFLIEIRFSGLQSMRHRLVVTKITFKTFCGQEIPQKLWRNEDAPKLSCDDWDWPKNGYVPIFFLWTIFFSSNSGFMRIDRCEIVSWSQISLSRCLVVSHYCKQIQKKNKLHNMSPLRTIPGLWLAERIQRELMQHTKYTIGFFFSMKLVFQDFNRCVIVWWSRKSQLQHLVVRNFRKNYKTTKTHQTVLWWRGLAEK